jgi:transcriptional regulator with XRE-family HTH domain
MFARGLTETELCEKLGLHINVWDKVCKGLRRPSHTLVFELNRILGDEVQVLFLGCYIDRLKPEIVLASDYDPDKSIKILDEKIKEVKKKGGSFVYLDY